MIIAEGLTYQKALKLIKDLEDNGIYSNITVGGVRISPLEGQSKSAKQIITKHGAIINNQNISTMAGMYLLAMAEETGKKIDISVFTGKD
jgi:hypothetical protein